MSSSESFDLLLDKGHSNGLQYSKPGTDYIGHRISCPWEFIYRVVKLRDYQTF